MQVANQRVRNTISVHHSSGDKKTLHAGAFVKAIKKCYLPKDHPFHDYDERKFTAAYSQFGMVLIPISELDWNVY